MATAAPLLSVSDLHTRFFTRTGVVKAVNGVSFDLAPGERMAIVGESGSGKSVTAMSLLRLVTYPGRIVEGSVRLEGREVLEMSASELNQVRGGEIGMIFQDPMMSLNPVLRVADQILPPMRRHLGLSQAEAYDRALELLRQVGIADAADRLRSYAHELSGGMRQRVLIAMAISCRPKLLIADEPTTALDVTIQAQIIALLKELAEATGTAILLVTHDLGLVARFAQKVAVMYAGRLVETAPVREIFARPEHPYTRGLLGSVPPLTGPRLARLTQIEGSPPDLRDAGEGCAFAPRCPEAISLCSTTTPALTVRSRGHEAACWVSDGLSTPVDWRSSAGSEGGSAQQEVSVG